MIKAKMNGIVKYDPTTGQDRVQVDSSGGPAVFALPTDGKYVFDAVVKTSTASNPDFATFRVLAGDSDLAWQSKNIDLTAATTSTGTFNYVLGPFESAKVAHSATSTSGGRTILGQRAIKIDYGGSTADGYPASSNASTGTKNTADIALFKLPEIEYTS